MLIVGLYVAVQAVRALSNSSHAEESALAFAIASASIVVHPVLAARKLRVAAALSSGALRGDGVLTLAGASLAGITLVALFVASRFGSWWADSAAALLIAIGLATEGARVIHRHRFG